MNTPPRPDIPNGNYTHHKGGVYDVFGLAQQEHDGAWVVLYRNPKSGLQFTMLATGWLREAETGVPRFTPLA